MVYSQEISNQFLFSNISYYDTSAQNQIQVEKIGEEYYIYLPRSADLENLQFNFDELVDDEVISVRGIGEKNKQCSFRN